MKISKFYKMFSFILITGIVLSQAIVFSFAMTKNETASADFSYGMQQDFVLGKNEIFTDEELIDEENEESKISISDLKVHSAEKRSFNTLEVNPRHSIRNILLGISLCALVLSTTFVGIKNHFTK